jgi:regulator-associated protein of mTOR
MHSESQGPANFQAYDVMEALFEEDFERLRARRRDSNRLKQSREEFNGHVNGMRSPVGSVFSMDSTCSSVILGLGTGAGIHDSLPLRSTYYDWCCEYFKEPQMRQSEADEPGSVQYNHQVWRQQQSERIMADTEYQVQEAGERSLVCR